MTKLKYQFIIWALITFAVGFAVWWVWIGTVLCLMGIFDFGKNSQKKLLDGLDHKFIGNVKESDPDWKSYYIRACESPAEEQFLEALIAEYNLLPDYGVLRSPELVCEMQFKFNHYRFDFLMNGRLIVEIDGATYHSSPEAMERDRIRDAYSVDNKFTVLRIPASIVFKQPKTAISRVKTALAGLNLPVKDYEHQLASEDTKSFLAHTGDAVGGLYLFLDDMNYGIQVSKHLDEFEKAIKAESEQVDFVIDYAENMIKYPDIYTLDHVSKLVWTKILLPKDSDNDKVRQHVNERVQEMVDKRNDRFKVIKERCIANEVFGNNMKNILIEMKCPVETGKKLSFSVYPFFYRMRHATVDDLN